ncbi:sulfatase-like hydrolase/transferase [Bacteroides helcogenes]|uniref:Sulfatase n=1 Tax=Bacteroides helcogenes (strain ATCC 35417 / DSM 20613 / JCM 6297 / CCUG 15421 / P 36-108) TaxID=693979 RepID=E6SQW2_BACT6|nr:sulfatase-like hydrolase/transferase [Bacteroides helcogenes]ADV45031.1 sulfatase [Bacteroides helcogenes P 36-108]MDY5239889.1 sulfatase-like hydrolase/transferase [Bacteroides helcogenes]
MRTDKLFSTLIQGSIGVLSLCGCSDKQLDESQKPEASKNKDGNYNILFILNDQEKYMPELPTGTDYKGRKFLREIGMTFQNHYSCSNVSTPSRSAIYTGCHITETYMMDNTNYPFQGDMDRSLPTLGDLLRKAGYYTAYKGKWHLSKDDTSLEEYGFSDWQTGSDGKDRHGSFQEGYEEDAAIAGEAIDWIQSIGKQKNKDGQSFFLAVNFINPHDIMYYRNGGIRGILETGSAPAAAIYTKKYPDAPLPATVNEDIKAEGRVAAHAEYFSNWNKMTGHTPLTRQGWEDFKDYYLNCIQDADNQLQHLLAYLKENDMLKNTIIIMSSDHGEMMGAHGLKGKGGFMYEDNIHVPLVIYHPEYEGKRTCNSITSHLDITPTILDMTHSDNKKELTSALKGQSMMPLLDNPSLPHRNMDGALFVFDMLSMIDGKFAVSPFDRTYKIHMDKRGFLRGMVNEEYKFARYFSPKGFNTPANLQELYDNNDVEIFAKGSDETDNLGYYADKADALFRKTIAERYNQKLNYLIEKEIGIDDGRETAKYVGGLDPYERK